MSKPTGFLEFGQELPKKRPPTLRTKDWKEILNPLPQHRVRTQAARCMDCGVPFCHTGCPLNNLIPEWNSLVYEDRWKDALERLHATNNFPEFTGWVCPAPCEPACVLGLIEPEVTIKQIERAIIDKAWDEDLVKPEPPRNETGLSMGIIGSGPAGLAAAQQLRRIGHEVVVYEKADRIGGLIRYGIPDFKMSKHRLDRRLNQLKAEGIKFVTNAHVGQNTSIEELQEEHDAILLAIGAEKPRDPDVAGSDIKGVEWAMDYLIESSKACHGDTIPNQITAKDKNVLVIGGGDTGSDCIGTALRQGAKKVWQFTHGIRPPQDENETTPWPEWPNIFRTDSSQEEGSERVWGIKTLEFVATDGKLTTMRGSRVGPPPDYLPKPDGDFELEVDLVLIAVGFTGPVQEGLIEQLNIDLTKPGLPVTPDEGYHTSSEGIFTAGDARRGASLVVWAIAEGRKAAAEMHAWATAKAAQSA
jgi:glutamate synthase (NADPH/NADH) small chain